MIVKLLQKGLFMFIYTHLTMNFWKHSKYIILFRPLEVFLNV